MRSVGLFSGPCEPLKGFDMDRTLCFAAGWRAVEGRQSGGRCWKLGRPQWAGGGENHGHFWRSHPDLLPVQARWGLWWPGLPQLGGGGAWRRRIWGPSGFVPEQRCSGKWGSPRADARKGVRAGSDAIRGLGPGCVSRGAPDGRCGGLALPGGCGGALMLSLPAPPAAFTGPPDPLHGSSLYQKVRAAAQVSPGPRSSPGLQLLWGQSSRGRGGGQTNLGQR